MFTIKRDVTIGEAHQSTALVEIVFTCDPGEEPCNYPSGLGNPGCASDIDIVSVRVLYIDTYSDGCLRGMLPPGWAKNVDRMAEQALLKDLEPGTELWEALEREACEPN